MFCPACGKEIPDDSVYCLKCGKSPHATLSKPAEPERESHTVRNTLLGVAFVALCALAIVNSAKRTSQTQAPEPLTPSSFVVKAAQISYFNFTLTSSARVSGRFEATGGSGNDIEAVITDADGFENWKNGHQARVFYQSGKTTMGNINVTLNPGTYYLAFNNKFSLLTDKTITGDIRLYH